MNKTPKKGYGYIYKYTSPSGKSYIGQTINSLAIRAGHNGKNYLGCVAFYQAILKYGFENFEVEILAEVPQDKLDELEKRYIEIFNTLIPNGYNIAEGGNKIGSKAATVYCYDYNDGHLIKEYEGGIYAVQKETGINPQALNDCLLNKTKSCNGFFWSRVKMEKYPLNYALVSPKEKKVKMYSLDGEFLMEFPSISKAAEYVGGDRSQIRRACRHELKSTCGYRWECSEVLMEKKYRNISIPVTALNITDGSVVQSFNSISEAARWLNKKSSYIRRVLDHPDHTAYGYKWVTTQGSTTTDP